MIRPAQNRGFTLIELLVSSALAMMVVALAITAFQQMRKVINRAEALMALSDEAQAIYMLLERSMTSMHQGCAMVMVAEKRTLPAPASPSLETGSVTLVFMTALEQKDNYETGPNNLQTWDRSSLTWEAWRWKRATGTVHMARNRPMQKNVFEEEARSFKIVKASDQPTAPAAVFRPAGAGTPNYKDAIFRTMVQPRRFLDPLHPFGGPDPADPTVSRLDDNMWFPNTATAGYPDPDPTTGITKSLLDDNATFKITEDVGDYSDLQRGLATPLFRNVTDWNWEVVAHDESVALIRIDDDANAASPTVPVVWQGVWLDGRLGAGSSAHLGAPAPFAGSDAAKRPRLIRLRFTLAHARTGVTQTFSFSFTVAGLSPRQ